MNHDFEPDFIASQAIIPAPADVVAPSWALVEIFGHRRHHGEIREVEAFGAKLLEVLDVDTGKVHRYGGSAIFSLTMLSQAEMDEYVAGQKRLREREAEWKARLKSVTPLANKTEPGVEDEAEPECRACGCTDDDCSGCIERTGQPCSWVEEDLCSACA